MPEMMNVCLSGFPGGPSGLWPRPAETTEAPEKSCGSDQHLRCSCEGGVRTSVPEVRNALFRKLRTARGRLHKAKQGGREWRDDASFLEAHEGAGLIWQRTQWRAGSWLVYRCRSSDRQLLPLPCSSVSISSSSCICSVSCHAEGPQCACLCAMIWGLHRIAASATPIATRRPLWQPRELHSFLWRQ